VFSFADAVEPGLVETLVEMITSGLRELEATHYLVWVPQELFERRTVAAWTPNPRPWGGGVRLRTRPQFLVPVLDELPCELLI
jgi:hypothetical protein